MSSPKITRMLGFFAWAWAVAAHARVASVATMAPRSMCQLLLMILRLRLREHLFPVLLHVDDRPAPPGGFVEGFVESSDLGLAVVGEFAVGVGVVDDQA